LALARSGAFSGEPPGPSRTLDDAFNEAAYYYACLNVDKAFQIMDDGIRTLPPTPRWYWHLRLYKWCFELAHANWWAYEKHSPEAKDFLDRLERIQDKADVDLLRLSVLRGTAGVDCSIPEATELAQRYPSSPWAPWARWQLIRHRALSHPPGSQLYAAEIAEGAARELRRELAEPADSPSIMRVFLAQQMQRMNVFRFRQIKEQYSLAANVANVAEAQAQEAMEAASAAWKELHAPLHEKADQLLLEALHYGSKKFLWEYYELLRASGTALPDCVPADKDVFMKSIVSVDRVGIEDRLKPPEDE